MSKSRIITAAAALALCGPALASGAAQEATHVTSPRVASSAPRQDASTGQAAAGAPGKDPCTYGDGAGGAEPSGGATEGAARRDRLREEQREEFLRQVWTAS